MTSPSVEVLFTPGGVHELRIPDAGRYRTISGYFNDPETLAAAATQLDGAGHPGIYLTLNPVNPALLARSENTAKPYAKTTTADHDITARRWFIVDLDPVRPAGIPSTDTEHGTAFTRAATIAEHLTGLGWPAPVVMDSGNGAYLLYRVDLPNSDDARDLTQRCLCVLATKFDDAVVVVDQTMYNAARIVRVPGTTNRKGSGSGDRPHRGARILSAEPGQVVPVDLLTALGGAGGGEQRRRAGTTWATFTTGDFDLEGFIARHLDATGPKTGDGREIWTIRACPFNPDHNRGEAYIGRQPSGALFAGCHHNSCQDWGWRELRAKYEPQPPPSAAAGDRREQAKTDPAPGDAPVMDFAAAGRVFTRWFGPDYDLELLWVMLAVLAAERLDGDPCWLLVISGPGNAKTETAQAAAGGGAHIVSTISSEAALLSGTPSRERAKNATGGLLRKVGDRGVLVIKDVTSILSAHRDQRTQILAALREIYDGYWSRDIGTEGGMTLTWTGRLAVIGAVTTAWDQAHEVVAQMGDRFVLLRADSAKAGTRFAAGHKAIGNVGSEPAMRAELAAAVGGVLAGLDATSEFTLTEDETNRVLKAADVVTRARTAVMYDYRGDVIDAHAPEMPTRFAKQLTQIIRGAVALGMSREYALYLAIRCARDSMPPMRLAILLDVTAHPGSPTQDVRRRIGKPRVTVDRQLQALHMLDVLTCDEVEYGEKSRWYYAVAEGIDAAVLDPGTCPEMSPPTPRPREEESVRDEEAGSVGDPYDISGQERGSCVGCQTPLDPARDGDAVICAACLAKARQS